MISHLPADIGVSPGQDALSEGRRLQLVLVKGELLHEHGGHVCGVKPHHWVHITRGLQWHHITITENSFLLAGIRLRRLQ